jgi:hypothetical protein
MYKTPEAQESFQSFPNEMFRNALRNVFGTLETYTFIEKRMETHSFEISL